MNVLQGNSLFIGLLWVISLIAVWKLTRVDQRNAGAIPRRWSYIRAFGNGTVLMLLGSRQNSLRPRHGPTRASIFLSFKP
jgi:hypothetical protein